MQSKIAVISINLTIIYIFKWVSNELPSRQKLKVNNPTLAWGVDMDLVWLGMDSSIIQSIFRIIRLKRVPLTSTTTIDISSLRSLNMNIFCRYYPEMKKKIIGYFVV